MLCSTSRRLACNHGLSVIQQRTYINSKNKKTRQNKKRKRKAQGKHTQIRQNGSGRMWCYHSLNMDYDKKFYLPFMNMLRNEGYWTPHWLDLHPDNDNKNKATPNEVHDPKLYNLREWNNEEGFGDPNTLELKERSKPHRLKPGKWGPPPSTPPQITRMEPPKPTQEDIQQIEHLKKK
eukprot:246472_1